MDATRRLILSVSGKKRAQRISSPTRFRDDSLRLRSTTTGSIACIHCDDRRVVARLVEPAKLRTGGSQMLGQLGAFGFGTAGET